MATTVTYKGSTIATVNNNTKTLKTAGTMMEDDVTLVDVSSGGTYQAKTNINPTTSSQTITADSGYDALSSVQINAMPSGTEGTPSATKGTVSNNSVFVTPSVTNVAGYISGGTKTGTAVTVSASELVSGTKTITENGTNIDVTNYASVDVSVSGGSMTTWETLKEGTFTIYSSSPNYMLITNYTTPFLENETYRVTWGSDTYVFQTASDGGYSYDSYYIGNAGVVGGQDDGSGATFFIYRDQASRAVAAVTDPAGSKFLRIEKQVSSSSGGNYQVKTGITPTTSSQTITADSGYDALESVQINAMPTGTAGTPTATKGTVSNHSISVTPSVTNTTGYITGSTKNGTAVAVSASELVSGSETKTANGTYDVTNLAQLVVNVSGGASNIVTGTFKGTTTGAAMDVTLNYSGSGYPVAVLIYPDGGAFNSSTTYYSTIQRYSTCVHLIVKVDTSSIPDYSANETKNYATVMDEYKNSTTNAANYTRTSNTSLRIFRDDAAEGSATLCVRIRSKTKMSVYIGSSYGFMANIDYKYWVMYSS